MNGKDRDPLLPGKVAAHYSTLTRARGLGLYFAVVTMYRATRACIRGLACVRRMVCGVVGGPTGVMNPSGSGAKMNATTLRAIGCSDSNCATQGIYIYRCVLTP